MPEGGLFSGMKFTDIFFPAAAAAASMYNPYVGRGIQTGLNTFNTFAAFQDSQRYYKRLKEEQERMNVGGENLRAGIDRQRSRLEGKFSEFDQRPDDEFGPLLDEAQTSQLGMFGDEGPELPDPDQEMAARQSLGDMEGQSPGQFGLGMEGMENPRFSEMNVMELPPALTEDQLAMRDAIEAQIWQQDLAESAIEASPGSAANQALMAGYRGMDTEYRDADRIKDMQTIIKQREDAGLRDIIASQLTVDETRKVADIWAKNKQSEQAGSQRLIDQQMSGRDEEGNLTASTIEQYKHRMSQHVDAYANPASDVDAKAKHKEEAISYAIMLRHAGVPLPAYMEEWIREHDKKQTAAAELVGGAPDATVSSHKSTVTTGSSNPDAIGFLDDVVPGWQAAPGNG